MNDFLVEAVDYDEAEICAGAFDCSDRFLAAGTFEGYALFRYPSLTLHRSIKEDQPFFGDVRGVYLKDEYLVLLSSLRPQSSTKPRDWNYSLSVINVDSEEVIRRIPLGPGCWQLVRCGQSSQVVLYDTYKDQGIRLIDITTESVESRLEGHSFRRLNYGPDKSLIGIGFGEFIHLDATGHLLQRYSLPDGTGSAWTAILPDGAGRFLLGGYDRATRNYVFQKWDARSNEIIASTTSLVTDYFTPDVIDYALFAEDCCGADIFEIANLEWIKEGEVAIAALGGGGEYLGACQSACAVVILDSATLTIQHSQVIDNEDGSVGLQKTPDGAYIVQCCSKLYVLRDGTGDESTD